MFDALFRLQFFFIVCIKLNDVFGDVGAAAWPFFFIVLCNLYGLAGIRVRTFVRHFIIVLLSLQPVTANYYIRIVAIFIWMTLVVSSWVACAVHECVEWAFVYEIAANGTAQPNNIQCACEK